MGAGLSRERGNRGKVCPEQSSPYNHPLDCPRVGSGQGQAIFRGPDPDPGQPLHPPAGPDPGYHYVRECIEEKKIAIFFIDRSHNPADLFTKNLRETKFTTFRQQLSLEFYLPCDLCLAR